MDVSIGLPNTVPGTSGAQLVEWARRAEARGFTSLGTIDRLLYPNYEPLTALAAAAAVTERIGLVTNVVLGPLRANAEVLAKQALSVHALSGERLTLGIGLGGREDDFEFAGLPLGNRGDELDAMLERMKEAWADQKMGPPTDSPPSLIVGGAVKASFARAAQFGDGWIAGGASPEQFAEMATQVNAAWSEAGRDGKPRLMGLAYFSLGDGAEEDANAYLTDYYAWLGEETANYIASSAATDGETVKGYLAAFEGAGCDELVLCPCVGDPAQVDLLADAAGL
jgi:alkanesulfonate monooxygenase SsuD/methylene tetrahydromethanopterin reductase-like flavin-dependent oxidoreductase (luciferase family)